MLNVDFMPTMQAPKRFGRKLTEAQKQFATHICADCGWIYTAKCAGFLDPSSALSPAVHAEAFTMLLAWAELLLQAMAVLPCIHCSQWLIHWMQEAVRGAEARLPLPTVQW
jgi:hypothetical protein